MSLLYRQAQTALSLGQFDWEGQPFFAALCSTDYQANDGHGPADVPPGALLAQQQLAGRAVVAGALDADDVVFPAVAGSIVNGVLIGRGTSLADCDLLVAYINGGTLPLIPSGTDVTVVWASNDNRILRV